MASLATEAFVSTAPGNKSPAAAAAAAASSAAQLVEKAGVIWRRAQIAVCVLILWPWKVFSWNLRPED